MSNIKASLTRKLGPLPAWAWLGILGVGLYLYRRHQASTAAASPTDQTAANTPAYYGPYGQGQGDSGGGGTTGGGGSGTGDTSAGSGGGGSTMPAPPVIDVAPPSTNSGPPAKSRLAKLRGKGAIRAKSGPHKPPAKKGYRDVGLGGGAWEYVPVKRTRARNTKPKSQPKATGDKLTTNKGSGRTAPTTHAPTSRPKATRPPARATRRRG